MPKNYPGLNTPKSPQPVPGVDYTPLAPPPRPKNLNRYPGLTRSRTKQYEDNLRVIEETQRAYQEQVQAQQQAVEKAQKKKAPLWAKALGYAAKGLQYTSASEWTRNAPVIGEYQKKLERIPGARTFLAAASNPLTYLGGAGVGVTGARAIATAGLAGAAGAAAGEAALSEEGLGLDIPLVPEKYEGMVGGIVGGIAAPGAAARIMSRGLGGLPGVGGLVPEGMKEVGLDARVAAKFAADAQLKAERAALKTGKPGIGATMFSADGGKTATFREPTPTKNAIQLGWDEVANPTELLQQNPIGDSNFVYATVDKPSAYTVAGTALRKGSRFYDNLDEVQPGEAVIRVKRKYMKFDKETGRPMAKVDILPGQVDVFTRDQRGGEIAWKQIAGLAADADGPKWTKFTVADEGEASKWFHDGEKWVYAETPEEFAAMQEAEKAARIAEAQQIRGADVQVPPMQKGQIPLPMQTAQQGMGGALPLNRYRNPAAAQRAADIATGLEPPPPSVFDDFAHPHWQQVIADTAVPDGGSSTNIFGQGMDRGFGLSLNPERTRIVPFDEWVKNPNAVLQQYAADNVDMLQDPKRFLGTWRDPKTGNISLDIASNVEDRAEGFRLMEVHNQKSMWDAEAGQVVENPRYDETRGAEAIAAGTATAPEPVTPQLPRQNVTLTHYGPQRLEEINPEFQGRGVPSEELRRTGPNPRVESRFASYYEEGQKPEKWFATKTGEQRPSMYKHTVSGEFAILDLNSPEGKAFRRSVGDLAGQELDDALQQAGYDGYKVGTQGTVRMFGKRAVTAVNDVPVETHPTASGGTLEIFEDGSAIDRAFPEETDDYLREVERRSAGAELREISPDAGGMRTEDIIKRLRKPGQKDLVPEDVGALQRQAPVDDEMYLGVLERRASEGDEVAKRFLEGRKPGWKVTTAEEMNAQARQRGISREYVIHVYPDEGTNYWDDVFTGTETQLDKHIQALGKETKARAVRAYLTDETGRALTERDPIVHIERGVNWNPREPSIEQAVTRADKADSLLNSIGDDLAGVDPRARPATGGAKFFQNGQITEVGNWIPDTLKLKYHEGKPADIVHGTMGRKTVQDVLGKMAASEVLLKGDLNWENFAQMVKSQFDIDLHAPVPGKKDQTPFMDFVQERTAQWVNRLIEKPKYDEKAGLVNMRRVIDLIQSADPVSGRWYEGTLPTSYELFGEEDGHMFLKFLAATSQQKSPRDNIQLALDAFADYKLGDFDDPAFKSRGVTDGVMERLRYSVEGGEPTGKKINSFYNNLTLDDFNVTVDRWMFRIFGFDDVTAANDKNVYEIIAHQMRLIGDELGMTPREVQARLWVAARNEASGGGRGVLNVVNEPYEELMLGGGRYTEGGQLLPDLEAPEGLPTAKQTLQQILDMRDSGAIDLPHDTTEAVRKADELVQETNAFRTGKVEASLERARSMADADGIQYAPEEDAATILDRVYGNETAQGPRFTAADEEYDAGLAAQKQLTFAGEGFAPNAEEVINYDPTSYARRSAELDDWAAADALDHQTLPEDLAQVRDDFRAQAERMTDSEVATRYQKDARTPEWQKRVLAETRPDAVEAPIATRGVEKSARPSGATLEEAARVTPVGTRINDLKGDLRRAGVPEEQADQIAEKYRTEFEGSAQSPGAPTEAGQALRAASRAEALGPNPYGLEAYARARLKAKEGPLVNGRPVVSVIGTDTFLASPELVQPGGRHFAKSQAAEQIARIYADSAWAPEVDNIFNETTMFAGNILERTEYRVGGQPPTYGGLYYDPKSLGFYNDVQTMREQGFGARVETATREETLIHYNPTGLFEQAQEVARRDKITVPEALADETIENGLHEMAHDLAYHGDTGGRFDQETQFLNTLARMKEAEQEIGAYRARLVERFQKMESDGTLLKWENDNARVRRTHNAATVRGGTGDLDRLEQAAARDVARVPEQAAGGGVRGEGVPASATGRGGEPAGSLRGRAELPEGGTGTGPTLRAGRPTVVRRGLDELGTEQYRPTAARRAEPGAPEGAPSSLEPESIKVRPPRVIEEAGKGEEFTKPLPEGRLTSAPRPFADVQADIFKNDQFRKVASRMAKTNGLMKRVLEAGVGKSATAVEPWERDIATFIVKREVDRSRIVGAIAELQQGKRPFVRMEGDLTKAIDWRGNEVTVPMSDVISNPKFFKLSEAQQGYVDRYHRIVSELVDDAKARGINIADSEKAGEFYTPRWVAGLDDIDIEYDYVKPGFGTKQTFEKPRFHRTAKEGMDRGVRYNDSEAALGRFAESIMKRTREQELAERLKPLGKTASELLGEEAKVPLKVVSKTAQQAKVAWQTAERELHGVEKKEAGRAGATRRLSSNDVRSMVNADDAVKTAVKERDEARRVRDDLQARYNKAKTPKAQERLGAQLDVSRNNIANAEARLKDARKAVRERIMTADVADIETRTTQGTQALKSKRENVAALKAEYEKQMRLVKQTKQDYRSRLATKQGPIGVRTSEFPRMGLSEDVVPVRQTRELPALQGRFFPAPVMDVIEKSLADKGSKALMNVAAVNDLARMFTTSTDFGATMLQGVPVLATNPKAWAKATVKSIQAWANPRSLQKYYAANREAINEMSHYAGGLSGNEFYSSAVAGSSTLIGKAAKSEIPLLAAPGQAVERFSTSFDAFLDISKIEMWKAMRGSAKTSQDLEQLGRFVRNVTGTTSTARAGIGTTQRQIESLLMFSPRFTRSVFALSAQALQKGPGGDAARRSLAGLIAGGMFTYAAAKMALHKAGATEEPFSWKDFDPRQGGRFMSIKVGDNWIGIGGSMRGAIQLLGTAGAAAATDPKKLFSTETTGLDANPFLKYARGRSSPAAGEVWNVFTGKDAIGEEYEGRGDWLSKLPDAFIPFAAQSVVETEGGAGTRMGMLGAQTIGLRTFPESKSEDLNKSLKDNLKKMATDIPGFSQAERDEVDEWADLTKYQKQIVLQRFPELKKQLDRKEQGYWNDRRQLTADYDAAKADLAQKYLETQRKQAAGEALTPTDLTAQQYRESLADIEDRHRTAEAQLRGANAITGLGGEDFPFGPRTQRQQVINDYYNAMDAAQFVDPETGQLDFNKRDEVESLYLAGLPQSDRDIISQEKGAEYDSVARDLKLAKQQLAPYWEIGDRIARDMGFNNAAEMDVYGTERQKQIYRKRSTDAKERFRKANPEVDGLLVKWGYTSKSINDRATASGGLGSKFGKKKRVLRKAL